MWLLLGFPLSADTAFVHQPSLTLDIIVLFNFLMIVMLADLELLILSSFSINILIYDIFDESVSN